MPTNAAADAFTIQRRMFGVPTDQLPITASLSAQIHEKKTKRRENYFRRCDVCEIIVLSLRKGWLLLQKSCEDARLMSDTMSEGGGGID